MLIFNGGESFTQSPKSGGGGVIECTYARRGAGRVPRARRIEAVRTAPGGRRRTIHAPCAPD
ncbi:hypothetical protein CBM2585_A130511 [Cupriavidus taiwanensis]|nr:hypothetical protein CBM2585_A130511 [Cupriavidus taiwanensis]